MYIHVTTNNVVPNVCSRVCDHVIYIWHYIYQRNQCLSVQTFANSIAVSD